MNIESVGSMVSLPLPASAETAPAGSRDIAVLQPFVDSHGLAGAVALVADREKILSLSAVGYADIAARKPMQTDTMFWIASQSKPITATAVMMLVDEGKIHLDDPVQKYLPEFGNMWLVAEQSEDHRLLKRPSRAITVRDILSHTSGMPFASEMEQPTLDLLPLREAALSYAMTPLQSEPGTKYEYSNAGINTAGRILEVVSGMPYAQFLNTRLFEPLGLTDTTFWPSKEQLTRLAKVYTPNADKSGLEETSITQLKYPLDDLARQPMPAGGLFSTALDTARFCRMILHGGTFRGTRYLSAAAIQQMTTKQTGDAIDKGYGLGWSTGGGVFGHGGACATDMAIDSNRGLITVFLVQHVGFAADGDQSHAAFTKAAQQEFDTLKK